ncbi:hypothetical protein JST97_26735 [bacterium]|nr:hypothetical protein [bacterium]
MITLVYSADPSSGEHRIEKMLDWKNFEFPEDRFDEIEQAIFELNQKYRGQREVSSKNAQNLLIFFQENPQFAPKPGLQPKGQIQ